jgi:hypothetical protein
MADPVSLAAIGIGSSVAGGGVGAIGSILSGQAQGKQASYQAGVARTNAVIAQQDANYALGSGEVEAQQSGERTRFQVGATKVGFGAGNVAGASTNRVLASETEIGQQNEGIIRANAAKRAYGFNVSAAEDTAQSKVYDRAASNDVTAGDIGAVSTILGTVGSVASKWSQASQSFGSTDANVNPDSAQGRQTYSNSIYS